jgi:hypothetical protein
MTDDPNRPGRQGWVIEPRAGAINIAIGPDVELAPDVRGALEDLVRALEAEHKALESESQAEDGEPETEGFLSRELCGPAGGGFHSGPCYSEYAFCGSLSGCTPVVIRMPCEIDMHCGVNLKSP